MTKPKSFFIYTFGCQMNQSDSERLRNYYLKQGFQETDRSTKADMVIINSCSVRQSAEDRVVGLIKNLAALPKRPKIVLTGCMLYHRRSFLKKKMPEIDEFLDKTMVGFSLPPKRKSKRTAWIPISTGCNSFCTYCVVPLARGREKSRPMADILKEVEEAIKEGYQEITLLGQNVNSYGLERVDISQRKLSRLGDKMPDFLDSYKKYQDKPPFVKLLERLTKYKELKKISFLTSNPWDFYDELIDVIAAHPVISRYLHIPVQSGSNRILRLMNRWYTAEDYLRLIEKIKSRVKGVSFGTDIIVGFPTETEADFQATLELAKKVKWAVGYIALYSPRPGTVANKIFKDDVPYIVKKRRFQILDKLINKKND